MASHRMAKGSIQHNDFAKHILLCLIRFLTVTTKTYNANNKNSPLSFLKGLLTCFGRESNPYGHCCPRDFLTTLAFTQAGFIHNAKPL